ncbi:MAG TPA: hypothetical protein PLT91_04175 [Clostridia bacterium]|nr:MAG: Beta-xylosidase [Firmicutes bacterium ADurb.Bin146]HOD93098.1 hypothetical protein [Clostridia bacterium]HQM39421.1 hypothetical protein [Clostridia bacterium]
MTISINAQKVIGVIKPVNSITNGTNEQLDKYLKEAEIPYTRLHDCMYDHQFTVDMPMLFPDFDKDEHDEKNYSFARTDLYISKIVKLGIKIIFRLGNSMEHGPIFLHHDPPKDFMKWARIACQIIRHYNEGWADGSYYNIEYWEIWNEPDAGAGGDRRKDGQWTGTDEQFYELYSKASAYIKGQFPKLMIGGYASCAVDEPTRRVFFEGFLDYLKKHDYAFDFFSYHNYGDSTDKIKNRIKYIVDTMQEKGFTNIPLICTEYCFFYEGGGHWKRLGQPDCEYYQQQLYQDMTSGKGAAYVFAAMITFQNSPVKIATLYRTDEAGLWNAPFNVFSVPQKPYYALIAFRDIKRMKDQLEVTPSEENGIYAIAAGSSDELVIAISQYYGIDTVCDIEISGLSNSKYEMEYRITDDWSNYEVIKKEVGYFNKISLFMRRGSIHAVKLKKIY